MAELELDSRTRKRRMKVQSKIQNLDGCLITSLKQV